MGGYVCEQTRKKTNHLKMFDKSKSTQILASKAVKNLR